MLAFNSAKPAGPAQPRSNAMDPLTDEILARPPGTACVCSWPAGRARHCRYRWRRPSERPVRLSPAFCGAFPVVRINGSVQNATHGRRARHSAFLRLCRSPTDHTVMGVWPGRPEDSGRDDGLARRACRRPPDCCATSREHWGASAKRLQRLVLNAGSTVFCARLVLAISPSGRSPASQDAASAYEIAPGVTSGSLLPDTVTRVT
jgi:hypothetical protein